MKSDLSRPRRPLLLLLLIELTSMALGSRTTACKFPVLWEGTWFQSGVRQSILISGNKLSSKGECQQNEGDKFLMYDKNTSCWRCVVIHEKHPNVLQYKETYCHNRNSLALLCSYITGDALLYSMFREEARSVSCPFPGPMTFAYNRGHGRCSQPLSNVDTCTDESRLLFKYQACPDVEGSESTEEELECLATWKEGSNRYLVGRLHNGMTPTSNEDRYRCFVYERAGQSVTALNRAANAAALGIASVLDHEITAAAARPIPEGSPEIYHLAQSGDATCNGLTSPLEGSRTMTLTKASSPGKCWFPSWLTGKLSQIWHTLDNTRTYTFHSMNKTLHMSKPRNLENPEFLDLSEQKEHDTKILCNNVKFHDIEQNIFMIVAHHTTGCKSGYQCMAFYKRDGHVVELQLGKEVVDRPEDACSSPNYDQRLMPYETLVTSSPEPRQCPYLGKFTVTHLNGLAENPGSVSYRGHKTDRVRHSQERRYEVDFEKRHGNNQYLVHEQHRRRARSSGNEESKPDDTRIRKNLRKVKYRPRREPQIEDFNVDMEHRKHPSRVWPLQSIQEVDEPIDETTEYLRSKEPPKKRSSRTKRALDDDDDDEETEDFDYDDEEDLDYVDRSRRRKRSEDDLRKQQQQQQQHRPRCNSELKTLSVGCSTADRMELQSECVEEEFAFTCHGRWFDAEGTQFVIATQLTTRRDAAQSWSGPDGSRAQPYRNSHRTHLCFMYRENGGVVSLSHSEVACERGLATTPLLLAFNATSIGQCVDGASSTSTSVHLILSAVLLLLAVFR